MQQEKVQHYEPVVTKDDYELTEDEQNKVAHVRRRAVILGQEWTVAQLRHELEERRIRSAGMKKQELIERHATAIADFEWRKLDEAGNNRSAQEQGFESAYERRLYLRRVEAFTRLTEQDVKAELIAKLESGSVLGVLEWGYRWAVAQAKQDLAWEVLGTHWWYLDPNAERHSTEELMTNPWAALQKAVERCIHKPLISNRWRGGSTSSFQNAVDACRREAASDLADRYI